MYKSHLNSIHINSNNYIPHALCNLIFTVFLFSRYLKLFQSKNMSFCHFNTLLFVPFLHLQQGKLTPTFLLDFWPANGHICISGFLIWTVRDSTKILYEIWMVTLKLHVSNISYHISLALISKLVLFTFCLRNSIWTISRYFKSSLLYAASKNESICVKMMILFSQNCNVFSLPSIWQIQILAFLCHFLIFSLSAECTWKAKKKISNDVNI